MTWAILPREAGYFNFLVHFSNKVGFKSKMLTSHQMVPFPISTSVKMPIFCQVKFVTWIHIICFSKTQKVKKLPSVCHNFELYLDHIMGSNNTFFFFLII